MQWAIEISRYIGSVMLTLLVIRAADAFHRGHVDGSWWRYVGVPIVLGLTGIPMVLLAVQRHGVLITQPADFLALVMVLLLGGVLVLDVGLNRFRTVAPFVLAMAWGLDLIRWLVFVLGGVEASNRASDLGVVFHTLAHALAFAAILFTAIISLDYLILHRSLKRKTYGFLYDRLPSLAELGTLMRQAAVTATVALLAAVGIGTYLYALEAAHSPWDMKFCAGYSMLALLGVGFGVRYLHRDGRYWHAVINLALAFIALVTVVLVNHSIAR